MADLRWNMAEVAELLGASSIGGGDVRVEKVVTDSRLDVEGGLYIALKGESFDGHSFLGEVAAKGAVGAVVERPEPNLAIAQIVVQDTLASLQRLATIRRSNFEGRVVAITGSSA